MSSKDDSVSGTPRPTIWIVDDSPLEAEIVRRTLALAALYEVEVFHDGTVLLARLAEQKPDVIIADWYMPAISGLELCQFIRASYDKATLPVIVLTALGKREDAAVALGAGANDYIVKPFIEEELTARIATAVEVTRTTKALLREAAFRERFIGILAHDLRQPLNTMVIGTSALKRRDFAVDDTKVVERVWSATRRMQRMIADLLDLTRARVAGGLPIKRNAMNFRDICGQVVEELQIANPRTKLTLTASGEWGGLWDVDRIAQVCTNLVGNAIQHGEPDAPVLVTVAGDDQNVTLTVENLGPPIAVEERAWIFDPFRRKRAPISSGESGLGLGLFIVEQIVIGHGGSIRVECEDGTTRFVVTLPRQASSPVTPA